MGWLSTSIVHDLRNPLGTVSAGSEMLMELDLAPAQVKRLAANIHRAAVRIRELLADLAGERREQINISGLQNPRCYRCSIGGGLANRAKPGCSDLERCASWYRSTTGALSNGARVLEPHC